MQREIILKTIELIEKSKSTKLTSRQIAAHCSINQAMINYYFGSKKALLDLAIKTTVNNAFPPLIEKIKSGKLPPKEIIDFVVIDLLTGVQNYPNISKYHFKSLFEENRMNYATRKYVELFQVLEEILLKHLAKSRRKVLRTEIKILAAGLVSIAVFPALLEYKNIKDKDERVRTMANDLTFHIKQLF